MNIREVQIFIQKTGKFFNLDRLFLLSPSFYSLVAGGLIGAATNLLTPAKTTPLNLLVNCLSPICFFVSSFFFIYISIKLEDIRSNDPAGREIKNNIADNLDLLLISLFLGLVIFEISLIALIYQS